MATIFITHDAELLQKHIGPALLADLQRIATVRSNPLGRPMTTAEVIEHAADCDIIISDRRTEGPRDVFERLPKLVAFQRVAVDIRNVDVEAASQAGVLVTRATPGFDAAVAEWIVGAMVDLGREITAYVTEYRRHNVPELRIGRQLRGSTLGIIGYGTIGRYLAQLGLALGMEITIADPYAKPDDPRIKASSLEDLLAQSDFVVCLAIANPQTENLMNDATFARMKPRAFFINASRGNLVDEAALERALDAKRIAGAALDVGREPDQMPPQGLAARNDVIATPHIAGHTPEAVAHQAQDVVRQATAIVKGEVPEGAVNGERAGRLGRLRG